MLVLYLKIGPNHFHWHLSQFIICIYPSTQVLHNLCSWDSVLNEPRNWTWINFIKLLTNCMNFMEQNHAWEMEFSQLVNKLTGFYEPECLLSCSQEPTKTKIDCLWDSGSHIGCWEMPCLSWDWKVHYHITKIYHQILPWLIWICCIALHFLSLSSN